MKPTVVAKVLVLSRSDMPYNRNSKSNNGAMKQTSTLKNGKKNSSSSKGLCKNRTDKSVTLRNISHKNSFGSSNWRNFIKMDESKASLVTVKQKSNERKLPLLKNRSVYENKNRFQTVKGRNQPVEVTKFIGMDCEMVGVGTNGSESVLARVSLVNCYGECIYDKYVKPTVTVTDYRTFVSGIRPHDLEGGEDFFKVQSEVAEILKGKTLVGHALKHDLQVLILNHPRNLIRDTTNFMKFRNEAKSSLSLKNLALQFLNVKIQDGEHDSVEDAKTAMQLYMTYRKEWEKERRERWVSSKKTQQTPSQKQRALLSQV